MGELQGKFTNSSIQFLVKFFQCLDNAVRIYDKMEMTSDGAKSDIVKQNLVGGIQVHHVKSCLAFMQNSNEVCTDWTFHSIQLASQLAKSFCDLRTIQQQQQSFIHNIQVQEEERKKKETTENEMTEI